MSHETWMVRFVRARCGAVRETLQEALSRRLQSANEGMWYLATSFLHVNVACHLV